MKVEREKAEFQPVKITLEARDELEALIALFRCCHLLEKPFDRLNARKINVSLETFMEGLEWENLNGRS